MKRNILFITFTLVGFSAFAYGGSDADLLFIPLAIIMFVFSVILFVKVWIMTNDVKKLKVAYVDEKATNNTKMKEEELRQFLRRLYFLGKTEDACDSLNMYTYNMLLGMNERILIDPSGKKYIVLFIDGEWKNVYEYKDEIQKRYNEVLDIVEPLYKAIGKEIPETLKTITYDKLNDFGK